ncbi:hypothetical protein [Neptuniibacter sp. QD37_11]|uniref:hypothetical protein n=1 Tax=Neptuniibacter sp. QD37_11 TaxID=3398209 RepID=UPI0039F5FAAF
MENPFSALPMSPKKLVERTRTALEEFQGSPLKKGPKSDQKILKVLAVIYGYRNTNEVSAALKKAAQKPFEQAIKSAMRVDPDELIGNPNSTYESEPILANTRVKDSEEQHGLPDGLIDRFRETAGCLREDRDASGCSNYADTSNAKVMDHGDGISSYGPVIYPTPLSAASPEELDEIISQLRSRNPDEEREQFKKILERLDGRYPDDPVLQDLMKHPNPTRELMDGLMKLHYESGPHRMSQLLDGYEGSLTNIHEVVKQSEEANEQFEQKFHNTLNDLNSTLVKTCPKTALAKSYKDALCVTNKILYNWPVKEGELANVAEQLTHSMQPFSGEAPQYWADAIAAIKNKVKGKCPEELRGDIIKALDLINTNFNTDLFKATIIAHIHTHDGQEKTLDIADVFMATKRNSLAHFKALIHEMTVTTNPLEVALLGKRGRQAVFHKYNLNSVFRKENTSIAMNDLWEYFPYATCKVRLEDLVNWLSIHNPSALKHLANKVK